MLIMRLRRVGKTNQPIFQIVLADHKKSAKGKFIEKLGVYGPQTEKKLFQINKERFLYWRSKGAQTSDTLNNILVAQDILPKNNLIKKTSIKKKKKKEEPKPEKPAIIEVPKSKEETPNIMEEGLDEAIKEQEKKEEVKEKIEEAKTEEPNETEKSETK